MAWQFFWWLIWLLTLLAISPFLYSPANCFMNRERFSVLAYWSDHLHTTVSTCPPCLTINNYILILVRIIHYDILLNVMDSDWFLHSVGSSIIVKEYTSMRVLNSHWSVQIFFCRPGFKAHWDQLHKAYGKLCPCILGISQTRLWLPLSVTHSGICTLKDIQQWSFLEWNSFISFIMEWTQKCVCTRARVCMRLGLQF
jgi:hypothetical protein